MSSRDPQDETLQDARSADESADENDEESKEQARDEESWDAAAAGPPAVKRNWPSFKRDWKNRLPKIKVSPVLGVALLLGGVVVAVLVGYLIFGKNSEPSGQPVARQSAPSSASSPQQAPPAQSRQSDGLSSLFGGQGANESEQDAPWFVLAASITLRLALAGLLGALVAFRPRKDTPVLQRNPYVAQTQILLAVVAAALMMIVADNAARAFGIFAAASLVRFRTNIRDPKEITVLLIGLAIGLASGVGKIEVAIILSLFSLLVLSILEYYEPQEIFRAMELTVTSRKIEETDQALRELFERRNITSELRKVDREDEDKENANGKIVYFVNVNGHLSTDQLSEEIFSLDPDNIDSITWDQKKTSSYIYR